MRQRMTNKEAIEILKEEWRINAELFGKQFDEALDLAIKALEEQERPTGEWICTFHSTFPQYEPSEYRCSICNGRGNESDKFCKHCGAKMQKEAENEK